MTKEHGLVLDTDDLTSIIRDPTSLCTVPPISEKHLLKKISLYALYKISLKIPKSKRKRPQQYFRMFNLLFTLNVQE